MQVKCSSASVSFDQRHEAQSEGQTQSVEGVQAERGLWWEGSAISICFPLAFHLRLSCLSPFVSIDLSTFSQ